MRKIIYFILKKIIKKFPKLFVPMTCFGCLEEKCPKRSYEVNKVCEYYDKEIKDIIKDNKKRIDKGEKNGKY